MSDIGKLLENGRQMRSEDAKEQELLDALEQLYKAPLLNDTAAIADIERHVERILKEHGRLYEGASE
jgi:hypothetical protein